MATHDSTIEFSTTTGRDIHRCRISFRPAASTRNTGGQFPSPSQIPKDVEGATRCVTPRQACPRPEGFGRNLRSKTRWFTGFCNSHQVSHFATFFIDARAEISVAESRLDIRETLLAQSAPQTGFPGGNAPFKFSLAHAAPGLVSPPNASARQARGTRQVEAPSF